MNRRSFLLHSVAAAGALRARRLLAAYDHQTPEPRRVCNTKHRSGIGKDDSGRGRGGCGQTARLHGRTTRSTCLKTYTSTNCP